jgi:hypothetical protein
VNNNPLPLVAYLVAVTWALVNSSKRWMTFLWIVVGLAGSTGVFAVIAAIWPDRAGVLGHVAAIPSLLEAIS